VGWQRGFTPSSAQRRRAGRGGGDAGARSSGGQSAALIRPRPLVRVQARPPDELQTARFKPEGEDAWGAGREVGDVVTGWEHARRTQNRGRAGARLQACGSRRRRGP
jgi:hypothetical protein